MSDSQNEKNLTDNDSMREEMPNNFVTFIEN